MPRNPTTGVFTRVSNSFSNPVYGTVIDPTDADELFDDYDLGITETPDSPSSSTDNAIARFDGTTGRFLQNSGVTIDDDNNISLAVSGGTAAIRPTTSGTIPAYSASQSGTGTIEQLSFNKVTISSDDVVAGTSSPQVNFVNGLEVNHSFGGASATGGRNAIFGHLQLKTATNPSNPYNFNAALLGWADVNNVTDATYMYGVGSTAHARGTASISGLVAAEFTVGIESTASANVRAACILNGLGGSAKTGTITDSLLVLTNQISAAKFYRAIEISSMGGGDPLDSSNGVILQTVGSKTVLHGIDVSSYTFTGGAFKSNSFSVDGSGNLLALSVGVTGTGGNGYLELKNQSAGVGAPTSAGRIWFDSSNRFGWKGTNGFTAKLNATGISADRIYTVPNYDATLATLAGSEALTNKTVNGLSITSSTGTLTVANGKTFTASNSISVSGTDGKSLTLTTSLAVTTNDGTLAFGGASKTLTVNNTLGLSGTDGSTLNVGTGGTLGTAAFVNTGTSGATVPLLNGTNTFSGATTFSKTGTTVTYATGANQNILFGQWGGDGTYNGIAVNGSLGSGTMNGFFGGNTGDTAFYMVGAGNIVVRPTGATSNTFTFSTSSLNSTVPVVVNDIVNTTALKTSTALVTTTNGGSTAAFTANMVGSTGGPTTAAQNGWVKMQDSGGNTIWVPVWK